MSDSKIRGLVVKMRKSSKKERSEAKATDMFLGFSNSKIIEKHHFCLLFGYLNYSIAFCNWEINRFNPKTCVASNQIMHNIVCVYTAVSPPHINIPDW